MDRRMAFTIPAWLANKKGYGRLVRGGVALLNGEAKRETEKAYLFRDHRIPAEQWIPKSLMGDLLPFDDPDAMAAILSRLQPKGHNHEDDKYFYVCNCGNVKVDWWYYNGEKESPEGVWECEICGCYYEWGT